MNKERLQHLAGIKENLGSLDDIPTKAIDMIDDMLAGLNNEARYGEQGDILRYILTKLQA